MDGYHTFKIPEASDFEARIAGITYRPEKGQEPNAFHRLMLRIFFGIVWKRRATLDKGRGEQ